MTFTIPGTQTYDFSGLQGECITDGVVALPVQYGLTPCVTVSSVRYWRMTIGFPTSSCQPAWPTAYFEPKYGRPTNPKSINRVLVAFIPWTCDYSMLTFTFPTVVSFHGTAADPLSLGTDLPVPGGGGTITVVP